MNDDSGNSKNDSGHVRFRMDFVFDVASMDEEARIVRFVAKPDPRRYEWRSENGRSFLYNKFDNLSMSQEDFACFIKGVEGFLSIISSRRSKTQQHTSVRGWGPRRNHLAVDRHARRRHHAVTHDVLKVLNRRKVDGHALSSRDLFDQCPGV